jgi:hypothetical protein
MEDALKFYEWLKKMGNIHLADNERMSRAYEKIIENSNNNNKNKKVCTRYI